MLPTEDAAVKLALPPVHTVADEPGVITRAEGTGLEVNGTEVLQPVGKVYTILLVPTPTPETSPDPSTVATDVFVLLHVPPAVAELNVVVVPLHIDVEPVRAAGGVLSCN
jgi:hypothetical protein